MMSYLLQLVHKKLKIKARIKRIKYIWFYRRAALPEGIPPISTHKNQNREQTIKAFYERLHKLQFETEFEQCRFLVVNILGELSAGFGANITRHLFALQWGYMYQRTVIMDYSSYQYERVYESIGKYSLEDVQKFRWKRFNFSPSQKDKVVYIDHDYFREFRFPARKEKLQSILHWVPSEFSRMGFNYAEFQGILHNWLRLKDEYRKYIEQKKKRIGFRNPIIGVHIRRGDKYTESPVISLENYLVEIRKLSDRTGIKTVFISTDSEEVIEAFEVIKSFSIQQNIEFIWDKDEVRYNNANYRLVLENPQLKKQETLTAIKALSLLESCDYLIGQVNVHFVLLPTYLKYARTGKNRTILLFLNQKQFDEFKEYFGSKADTEMSYQIANSVM